MGVIWNATIMLKSIVTNKLIIIHLALKFTQYSISPIPSCSQYSITSQFNVWMNEWMNNLRIDLVWASVKSWTKKMENETKDCKNESHEEGSLLRCNAA